MEAEMALRNLSFSYSRLPAVTGVVAFAILASANVAQPQAVNTGSVAQLPTSMHRVADTTQNGAPNSFADLAEKVEPAVIGITSNAAARGKALPNQPFRFGSPEQGAPREGSPKSDDFGPTIETISIGSGFFISPDGYAVTNSHAVEDSDTAEIRTSDNKIYSARLIANDRLSDLALIKVDGRTDFSYVKIADQPPRVGDWVLTVGNPFGLAGTVTAGIVSAREREIDGGPTEGFIQIDAPINSGDSGGPSFNTNGEVIGVNSMILSPTGGSSGVALAIPADTVKTVIPQLKEKGAVTRGSMGAEVQSVTPEIADGLGMNDLHGAIVASVQNNGPAAKAGIRGGDVITSVGGEPIRSANALTKKIHAMAPGSSVELAMVRGERKDSVTVTLGQLPDQSRPSPANPR
jgi:serine protease Do